MKVGETYITDNTCFGCGNKMLFKIKSIRGLKTVGDVLCPKCGRGGGGVVISRSFIDEKYKRYE